MPATTTEFVACRHCRDPIGPREGDGAWVDENGLQACSDNWSPGHLPRSHEPGVPEGFRITIEPDPEADYSWLEQEHYKSEPVYVDSTLQEEIPYEELSDPMNHGAWLVTVWHGERMVDCLGGVDTFHRPEQGQSQVPDYSGEYEEGEAIPEDLWFLLVDHFDFDPSCGVCDQNGGWLVCSYSDSDFDPDSLGPSGPWPIQRCDECLVYDSDLDAAMAFAAHNGGGDVSFHVLDLARLKDYRGGPVIRGDIRVTIDEREDDQ